MKAALVQNKYLRKILPLWENGRLKQLLLLIEILILTAILASLTGGKGVDYDESFTHKLVTYNDAWGIIQETAADVHPPLYYLIVKLATTLFGNTLRVYTWTSLSAAIGCMLLSSTLLLKRFGFQAAGAFNFAIALAPTVLYYNLNIRMYSWMAFFVLGCILFGREVLEKSSFFNWGFLFFFSICGVYTQYFAVLPIAAVYFCILLAIVLQKKWKKLIPFGLLCAADVLLYLPWINFAMVRQFHVSAPKPAVASDEETGFLLYDFFDSSFSSNIELGAQMALVLFLFCIVIFIFTFSRYSVNEKYFIFMLIFADLFTVYASSLVGRAEAHFFAWRYAHPSVLITWLLLCIILSRITPFVYSCFCVWLFITCMSSYVVNYNSEYNTTPFYDYTVAFTDANIAPDSVIVYDYPTFDTLYEYYLPGHEFIFLDDLDLDKMKGQTFWFIQLGGGYFSEGAINGYGLEIEHYEGFGYIGMVKFNLEKVTVPK